MAALITMSLGVTVINAAPLPHRQTCGPTESPQPHDMAPYTILGWRTGSVHSQTWTVGPDLAHGVGSRLSSPAAVIHLP